MQDLDTFTRQYLETALWSSNDESTPQGGEPFDANYSIDDIAPECVAQAVEDCKAFQETSADDLARAGDASQNGHDFWLTRNRHGAGFWDRGYDKDVSKRLTDSCHAYGEINLYLGDDGLIYCQ